MNDSIFGFLGLMRRAGALAVGAEDAFDMARENKARLLCVAADAAANTVSAMHNAAAQREEPIPLIVLDCTKRQLGATLGVRECAALAVLDTGFALSLCQKLPLPELLPPLEARLAREQKRRAKKLAGKQQKPGPHGPPDARGTGAVRRISEKRPQPGRRGPGPQRKGPGPERANAPGESRGKRPRVHQPRVIGKRGN